MPADDPFTRMLGDIPDLPGRLDARSIIRRSRRRRMAQRVAIGGVAAVAVIGVVGGVGLGFSSLGINSLVFGGAASSSSAGKADSAPEFATGGGAKDSSGESGGGAPTPHTSNGTGSAGPQNLPLPAGTALRCPAPAPWSTASATALSVSVSFPKIVTGKPGTYAEVTLTNAGTSEVAGLTTATTEVTLSSGGTLRWVGLSSDLGAQGVTLSAGGSHTFVGHFDSAVCGTIARSAIPAGDYDAVVLVRVSIRGETQWIVGAPTPVTVP